MSAVHFRGPPMDRAVLANPLIGRAFQLSISKSLDCEYGHIIAECIRELPRVSGHREAFKGLPSWKEEFNEDEELFAEDFARFMVTYDALSESFWDAFMPKYVAEFKRIFIQPEGRYA